jgi:hypothetical protein
MADFRHATLKLFVVYFASSRVVFNGMKTKWVAGSNMIMVAYLNEQRYRMFALIKRYFEETTEAQIEIRNPMPKDCSQKDDLLDPTV